MRQNKLSEAIQDDLVCILDGQPDDLINQVCDAMIKRCAAIENGPTIKRYGYRTAHVVNCVVEVYFKYEDSVWQWKQDLARPTIGGPDNHEVYLITFPGGGTIAVRFSDWVAYIGTGVREGCW